MKNRILKTILTMSLAMTVMVTSAVAVFPVNAASVSVINGVVNFNRGDAQITIQGIENQTLAGKKFNVYKILLAENAVGMESINYTFNPEYKSALQNIVGSKLAKTASDVTEYEVVDYIQSLNKNQVEGALSAQTVEGSYSDFRYFVEELRNEIESQNIAGDVVNVNSVGSDNKFVMQGLEYGYYIVDEDTQVDETHSAASLCIVNTANPTAEMTVKSDYPELVKKIQEDDNKAEAGNNGWNDIGDFEIGQTVPYRLESEIPNINGYHTYYYAWHDVMDEELTFHPDSVTIEIKDAGGNAYTLAQTEFTVTQNPGNGDTFMVEVNDIKAIVDREFNQMNSLNENVYGQDVILTYNATLNDKAAKDMGRAGYENDVRLEFSNNPDSNDPADTGYTPWDTVVCFTYQLNITKTNNHDLELANAKFRLYSDAACTNEVYVKLTEDGYNVINRDVLGGNDHVGGTSPAEAIEMVTDNTGSIIINGLDDGTYYLKETAAPAGYRKILDPIVLKIDATYTSNRNGYVKGDGATDQALKTLDATAHIKTFLSGAYSDEDITLVTDLQKGAVYLTVVNAVGSKLPVTGSAMMLIILGAGVALVVFSLSRKKKKA